MRLPLPALLAATLVTSPAAAQRVFDVGLGGSYRAQRDDLASPLRYAGLGPGARLEYAALGGSSRFAIVVQGGTARLTSPVSTATTHYERETHANLSVAYLRRIHDGRLGLFLGSRLDADGDVRFHTYDRATVGREVFADLFTTLDAMGTATLPVGPGSLSMTVAVPLVSLALRTPYTGAQYVPAPEIRTVGTIWGVTNRVGYRWLLSRRFGLSAFHLMRWLHYPTPRPLTAAMQQFGVSLSIVVGGTR
jgi:hypothetical protein